MRKKWEKMGKLKFGTFDKCRDGGSMAGGVLPGEIVKPVGRAGWRQAVGDGGC
jgi:hypothetical protein